MLRRDAENLGARRVNGHLRDHLVGLFSLFQTMDTIRGTRVTAWKGVTWERLPKGGEM